jgi:hypothetical protein
MLRHAAALLVLWAGLLCAEPVNHPAAAHAGQHFLQDQFQLRPTIALRCCRCWAQGCVLNMPAATSAKMLKALEPRSTSAMGSMPCAGPVVLSATPLSTARTGCSCCCWPLLGAGGGMPGASTEGTATSSCRAQHSTAQLRLCGPARACRSCPPSTPAAVNHCRQGVRRKR